MCQARPTIMSLVLSAQWCIKQQQRVKLQIKQFEVPYYVGGSWKTSHIVISLDMCAAVWCAAAGVGLSPIKGSSHKTENYVQISTLPPHLCAGSWPQPTRDHTISQHYCLLSQNSLPTPFPSSTPQSCSRLCSFTRVSASWTSVGPNYSNYSCILLVRTE